MYQSHTFFSELATHLTKICWKQARAEGHHCHHSSVLDLEQSGSTSWPCYILLVWTRHIISACFKFLFVWEHTVLLLFLWWLRELIS